MNQEECKEIKQALDLFLNESLERILMSNPTDSGKISRSRIRPLLMKGRLVFQAEEQAGKQAFHRNLDRDEAADYVTGLLDGSFRQAEIASGLGKALILVSRKGKVTVKVKQNPRPARILSAGNLASREPERAVLLSHNRKKHYILEEGIPVPFLVDLGVMTKEGRVVNSRYDKYRQINRFLEFIEDILPNLDQDRESTIIDFGCGKSYLTFAMYYYLKELKGYPVRIIGLDLKEDVIEHCSRLGRQYGYEGLSFCHGDIASFEGVEKVDMVVTLHACDLATYYALEKAVNWGARVILSVPCCQHELNGQMENSLLRPVLQYGLIKERMAALYTDAIRAQVLEYRGYRTQILEFIDMEHTPKNILIRAVRQGKKRDNGLQIRELADFLHVKPTVVELLAPELWESGEKTKDS
ncbi:class I SAM-dependent methyltransferase [Enterocloster bolteae]|uniref:class I SAM-dependent methyltransferase n=1 Tax=Enterocloster bolteae TaxID=208479 RepID=UPI00189F79E6|nr:SAM-dependent methyltransferase [Enterocloster bolteae]